MAHLLEHIISNNTSICERSNCGEQKHNMRANKAIQLHLFSRFFSVGLLAWLCILIAFVIPFLFNWLTCMAVKNLTLRTPDLCGCVICHWRVSGTIHWASGFLVGCFYFFSAQGRSWGFSKALWVKAHTFWLTFHYISLFEHHFCLIYVASNNQDDDF